MLNAKELEKYSRQTILIGEEAQEKISKSKVVIIGCGALGTNSAELLARAGVGEIIMVDDDFVENSNLQRQTLFDEGDLLKSKTDAAEKKLRKINSLIKVKSIKAILTKENTNLLDANLVLDATDNLETRFIINDYCKDKIPWIYASCVKYVGSVMAILPQQVCLRCFLEPAELDNACTAGIINTLPAMISGLQVTLALSILLGEKVSPILYYLDLREPNLQKIKVKKNC